MTTKTPEPHQLSARDFLSARFHAACGDDPGLMKTSSALWAVERAVGLHARGLVTCPASVRSHWSEHLQDHGFDPANWDVISYNGACDPALREHILPRYDVWIGDEIHFCKSIESQRSAAVLGRNGLARRARYKWPLSGTMAPNGRPLELWPMLKTLAPAFRNMKFATYAQKYCNAYWDGRSMNTKGASRLDELAALLKDFMIRRTEAEVYPDRLAPLVERIPVDLTPADFEEIRRAEDEIGGREARLSPATEAYSQLGDTSRLRRLLGMAKLRHVVGYVSDLLETVDKVVVFAHHRDVCAGLSQAFYGLGYHPLLYVGGMNDAQKDLAKTSFIKCAENRVFIGQDDAAGTGVDGLQHATSRMVLAEPSWVPGETEQRIRRLARTGQKEPLVKASLIYARNTLDGVMTVVHDGKKAKGERLLGDAPAPRGPVGGGLLNLPFA